MRTTILSTLFMLLASVAFAQVPVDSGFTYQGELQDAGSPIDGSVDLLFTLYDAELGGAAVAGSLQLDDVAVAEGIFSVRLDFGDVWDGEARWLEIQVRNPHDPGDSDPFVLLDPRQAVTAAPYALHALNAPGYWDASGSAIINNNPGFVGVGRANQISGNEVFGLYATDLGYGGMYIDVDGAGSKPFYGYNTDSYRSWTYLDGDDGSWRLWHSSGDRLAMTSVGNMGIGTTTPSEKLEVAGTVYSTSGGFKFPDGTVQTSAASGGAGDGHSLDASDGSPIDVVFVDAAGTTEVSGFLGVGRNTTVTTTEVFGIHRPVSSGYGGMYASTDGGSSIPFYGYTTGTETAWTELDGANGNWNVYNDGVRMTVTDGGHVGIGVSTPLHNLDVHESSETLNAVNLQRDVAAVAASDLLQLRTAAATPAGAQFIEAENGLDVKFRVWADGNVSADGSFTGGGADFAEIVKVEAGAGSVEPGDVLVIDRNARRGFARSTSARSTLVAGVYSTQPGVLASNRDWDELERSLNGHSGEGEAPSTPVLELARQIDEIPLAVVGIVPCKVSAENGPIAVGDLLVTAATPGHAMRGTDIGFGMVLGKALEPLNSGTGVIEIMVQSQ